MEGFGRIIGYLAANTRYLLELCGTSRVCFLSSQEFGLLREAGGEVNQTLTGDANCLIKVSIFFFDDLKITLDAETEHLLIVRKEVSDATCFIDQIIGGVQLLQCEARELRHMGEESPERHVAYKPVGVNLEQQPGTVRP